MNLVFNAEALRPPITGVGNYSYHLLAEHVKAARFEDIQCFTGTHWQSGQEQLAATAALKSRRDLESPGFKARSVAQLRQLIGAVPGAKPLYEHIMDRRFERHARSIPNALYHETNYILKPYSGPTVTTVHDLSHIRFPQYHPPNIIEWLGGNLENTLQRADRVIAVSEVVRQEILQYYPVKPDKVHTVHEGVGEDYRPRDEAQTAPVLADLGLKYGHYVLLVATLEPRKGIDVLLEAWGLVDIELRRSFPLVLAGSRGWRNSSLVDKIGAFIEEGTVHHLGYVLSEVLPLVYSGAAAFCYPSVYEGFGLPVLDAMASGVPVICRSGTSMAEFAEGACMLCDSAEPEELAQKLAMLLESPADRTAWGQKGLQQAQKFSWERCARETADVYRMLG